MSKHIHKKRDGYLLIDTNGLCRFLTFWESVKYRLGIVSAEDLP